MRDHPKTRKLARLLSVHRSQAIGHMMMVWWWALEYAQDGDLGRYSNDEIADAADWPGDPDLFVTSAVECGPDGADGFFNANLTIHNWDQYAGRLIDRRTSEAERKRNYRRMSAGRPQDVPGMSCVDKTRLEKSRVDQTREEESKPERQGQTPCAADASPTTPKGTRIPASWQLSDEDRAHGERILDGTGLDVEAVADLFRDYWLNATGVKGLKLDWPATWRTWCRNQVRFAAQHNGNGTGPALNGSMEENAKVIEAMIKGKGYCDDG